MTKHRWIPALALTLGAALSCRISGPKIVPGPSFISFPLVEWGSLDIPGPVNPPARLRGDTAYLSTPRGAVIALSVSAVRVVWTFETGAAVPAPPEVGENHVYVRDDRNVLHILDLAGRLTAEIPLPAPPSTRVREYLGTLYFGTADGRALAVAPEAGSRTAWEFRAGTPLRSGPVFSGGRAFFGGEDGHVLALDRNGNQAWTFAAQGAVAAEPAVAGGRVYFGTSEGFYYSLDEATGKKRWAFKLDGEPLHAPRALADRVVFAVSTSVVYCLSRGNGEILWWRTVPSRVVYEPVLAGQCVFLSGASPELAAYDLIEGHRTGEYRAGADLLAGPVWVPPRLLLLEAGPSPDASRLVILSRDAVLTVGAVPASLKSPGRPVEFKASAAGFDGPVYEFYLEENGARTLMRGPSAKNSWTWRPGKPGSYRVIVRAFDRVLSREAGLLFTVEKPPGKT